MRREKRDFAGGLYSHRMGKFPKGLAIPAAVIAGAVLIVISSRIDAQSLPDSLHGFVVLSSKYVLNGLSQTEDQPSVRASLDFEHRSGFFVGGLLANVDYVAEDRFRTPRDIQVNLYAGYVWRRNAWMTNLTLSRYRYPGIARNYDYSQATINVSFRERYFLGISRSSDLLSVYDSADIFRGGVAVPFIEELEFSANAGRLRSRGFGGASHTFWDVGLSRPIGKFAVDLRYYDSTNVSFSLLGNDARDSWVLSISYAFLPTVGRNH